MITVGRRRGWNGLFGGRNGDVIGSVGGAIESLKDEFLNSSLEKYISYARLCRRAETNLFV